MNVRDFVAIFSARKKLCLSIIGACILLSLATYRLQIQAYNANVMLSVTRSGSDASSDYRFHEFYRLQADERFSDSIVRFLQTPQALHDIASRAGLSPTETAFFLGKGVKALRLSSNIISVNTQARTVRIAESLAAAVPQQVNAYSDELNQGAQEPDWFRVVGSSPDITDARFSWREAFGAGAALGVFLAFWTALIDFYWNAKKEGNENRN